MLARSIFRTAAAASHRPRLQCPALVGQVRSVSVLTKARTILWRRALTKEAKFPLLSEVRASSADVVYLEYDGTADCLEALGKQCADMFEARAFGVSFQKELVKTLLALSAEASSLHLDSVACIVVKEYGTGSAYIVNTALSTASEDKF